MVRSIQLKFPGISVQNSNESVRSNRKSFERTGAPFKVDPDHFSRSEILVEWIAPNKGFSFSFGRVSRPDSEPPGGTLLLLLKTTVFQVRGKIQSRWSLG